MLGQRCAYTSTPSDTSRPSYNSHQTLPAATFGPPVDPSLNLLPSMPADTHDLSSPTTVPETSKSRKPRKKQAVRPTNSAATKAIVKKNVSTSVLLSAPTEVRDNILRFLMGDRLIHIKYFTEKDHAALIPSDSKNSDSLSVYSGLCSAFCVAKKSEQEAYDEANLSSGKDQRTKDPDYIASCRGRHKNCLMCGSKQKEMSVTKPQAERLTFATNLSVLAVCRLLYEESNNVLWQTNIFSFDDSLSFIEFISSMNVSQKYKLKKIHIRISVSIDRVRKALCTSWARAVAPRMLTPLKNLKIVHLSLDQYSYFSHTLHAVSTISNTDSQLLVKKITDTMLGLRTLPWKDKHNANRGKHVTVIISDDASTKTEFVTPRWTKALKLETAEALRAQLAAPNSAEIHAAAKEAEKVAKEAEQQGCFQDQKEELIRQIDSSQLKVDKAKEEAKERRSDADRSESKLNEAVRVGKGENSVKRMTTSMRFCNQLAKNAEARLEKREKWLAVIKARLAKLQARSKNPNGKKSSGTIVAPETE